MAHCTRVVGAGERRVPGAADGFVPFSARTPASRVRRRAGHRDVGLHGLSAASGPRRVFATVPRRAMERFERELCAGTLDGMVAAFLAAPPSGRLLASHAQAVEPGLYDELAANPLDLLPAEYRRREEPTAVRPGKRPHPAGRERVKRRALWVARARWSCCPPRHPRLAHGFRLRPRGGGRCPAIPDLQLSVPGRVAAGGPLPLGSRRGCLRWSRSFRPSWPPMAMAARPPRRRRRSPQQQSGRAKQRRLPLPVIQPPAASKARQPLQAQRRPTWQRPPLRRPARRPSTRTKQAPPDQRRPSRAFPPRRRRPQRPRQPRP